MRSSSNLCRTGNATLPEGAVSRETANWGVIVLWEEFPARP
jgi:hypothetical protein